MPKIYITEEQRASARLAEWAYGQMKMQKISQKKVAEERGLTQQAIYNKLQRRSFDYGDFLCFVKMFQPDDKTLLRVIRGD